MPPRRITEHEFEAAKTFRDTAKDELWQVLPKLNPTAVVFGIGKHDGEVSVTAKIAGDTTPYDQAEVHDYLGALGINDVSIVEL